MSRVMSAPGPMNPSADINSVMGTQAGPQQGTNLAEEIRATMRQIRELMMQVDGIAQQFPVASDKLDVVKTGLMEAMKTIVANQTGPEPAASPMVG